MDPDQLSSDELTPEQLTDEALRPRWLSHHHVAEVSRCARFGTHFVCRRCLFITVGLVPAMLVLVSPWRAHLQAGDVGLVLAVAVVAGLDFAQTSRGSSAYSARRVALLSPAVGGVMAWLAVTGATEGIGVAHGIAGAAAVALLGVLASGSRCVPNAGSGRTRAPVA